MQPQSAPHRRAKSGRMGTSGPASGVETPYAGWGPPPPPPRQSFWREHGGAIIAGVIITVAAAAVIAVVDPVRGAVCKLIVLPVAVPFCEPQLGPDFLGDWRFVQAEGEPPFPTPFGTTIEPRSLQLVGDQTYTLVVQMDVDFDAAIGELDPAFAPGNTAGGQLAPGMSQELPASGRYRVIDRDTIELVNPDGEGLVGRFDLSVSRGLLRLQNTARPSTMVFQRGGT